jgi:ribosomal protein L1
VSFEPQALLENLAAVVEAITRSRAEGIKGNLYRSIHITSSMGPSCDMNILEVQAIEIE